MKRTKAEEVKVRFRKNKDGCLIFELGNEKMGFLPGDTCIGIVSLLCEAEAEVTLLIEPNMKGKEDKNFPGEDLRYWRGKVVKRVKE